MSLAIGTRLGCYEIVAPLGAGGMGEVYLARDTKLNRQVAIKVLPEAFSQDAERLARFTREAQTLAALNHPGIAAIYGIEQNALVMELVEGDDLSVLIARSSPGSKDPGLHLTESLAIARQIAEALEAAHEAGIVHRDLKPANIRVRADGTVKVLDFGLAKAMQPAGASTSADAMSSPTITSPAMTEVGMILGTAAYMAPEQARGRTVDKRADVWAFGVIAYEMLTGTRLFVGAGITDVLAAVLRQDIDWNALPAATPLRLRRLLERCLDRDVKQRLRDIGEARVEIAKIESGAPDSVSGVMPLRPVWRRALPWALVAALSVALAIAVVILWRSANREQPTPVYSSIDAPAESELSGLARTPMVFTPDGRSLLMQATRAGKSMLFRRSLESQDALPITGTDNAQVPFVSPDGKWMGFFSAGQIRKVPMEGGAATTVCALTGGPPYGAAWGPGDVIVFGDPSGRIMRVPASGGTPAPVTAQPPNGRRHVAPFFFPDDKRLLLSDVAIRDASDSRLMVQSLDGGDARLVMASAADGRLLPSGQLVFMRLGTLMTVPFDVTRAETKGDAMVAINGVRQSGLTGSAGSDNTAAGMFAVSRLGTLAVIRGSLTGGGEQRLIWKTRDGRSSPAEPANGAPAGGRIYSRISPDGSRAIVAVNTPVRREMWFANWKRDVWSVCGDCNSPLGLGVWSADGTRLLLSRNDTLVAHTLDSAAADQVLVQEAGRDVRPSGWLADGRIVYRSTPDQTNFEIKFLEPGSHTGRVVVALGIGEGPEVSPDGRWLAYSSPPYASGARTEVVVQAFPGPGSRTPIGSGINPSWSADSRTLYYLRGQLGGEVMVAVDISASPVFTAGKPREVVRSGGQLCSAARCYDISADGQRFLFYEGAAVARAPVTRMDLITNWAATLGKGR